MSTHLKGLYGQSDVVIVGFYKISYQVPISLPIKWVFFSSPKSGAFTDV
jgi:hypothetical protein